MTNFNDEIPKILEVLRTGGLILYPTDTIWGIGCDASNPEAVQKIYALKKREDSKSMLVLLDYEKNLSKYVDDIPDISYDLIEMAVKPITIIYPKAANLAANLIADDGSIGIRISRDIFNQTLIRQFKRPIVSTSANISGTASPSIFEEIQEEIKEGVDYIVEWRQNDQKKAKASQIIQFFENGSFKILRE